MSAGPPPSSPPPPLAPPPQGPADAEAAPGPRRLTRQLEGRLLGGVATGLAACLGIDVVVVRIALVVLAFIPFPGFGVLVYVAMLLLVPGSDGEAVVVPNRFVDRSAGFWVGIGLVGFAMITLLGVTSTGRFGGNLVPLLLIGLGIALWVDADRRSTERRTTGAAAAHPGPPVWESAGPPPAFARTGAPQAATAEPGPVWESAPAPPPPVVPPTGPAL
ncbi:MAG: PspC domain-containing protein, partial [Nitriliruptor sp.]